MDKYSKIDKSYELTEETWVISLANTKTRTWDLSLGGGHAKILVEGIRSELPFSCLCDVISMTGEYITEVRISYNYDPSLSTHWAFKTCGYAEAGKAQAMLSSIERDKARVDKDDPNDRIQFDVYRFLFFKSKSPHNCMSWCKEKLAIAGIGVSGKDKPKKIGICLPVNCCM